MGNRNKKFTNFIGIRIKHLREQKGLTQKELGLAVNKGDSTVRMWELGKSEPDLATTTLIAKTLDVSLSYLLGEDDFPIKENELIKVNKLAFLIDQLTDEETEELSKFVDYLISKRK